MAEAILSKFVNEESEQIAAKLEMKARQKQIPIILHAKETNKTNQSNLNNQTKAQVKDSARNVLKEKST